MKLLVLGAAGQFGRDFMTAAESHLAIRATALDRAALDVADPDALRTVLSGHGFDALVNFTAVHRTDAIEAAADAAVSVNVHAVRDMARICRAKGAAFYHVSTDYVFGGDEGRTRPYREDDPTAPVSVYGATKALGETLARLEHDGSVIIRVASLFGVAGAQRKGGNFIETMLRLAREGKPLRVVDDQIMSPTATADAAPVLARLIADRIAPGTYHLVNGGETSWHGFAREIFRLCGVDADLTAVDSAGYPTPARRPRYSVLDTARLSALYGPPPHWRDALRRYLVATGHARDEPAGTG